MRKIMLICFAMAFLTVAVLFDPAMISGEPPCRLVAEWGERNAEHLPKAYWEIVTFPYPYRIQIFSRLTSDEKARFFQEQISNFLASDAGLSEGQVRFLEEARQGLSRDLYEGSSDPAFLVRYEAEAAEILGPELALSLFQTLGPREVKTPLGLLAIRTNLTALVKGWFTATAFTGSCICNQNIWCQWYGWGNCDLGVCEATVAGCGLFGNSECTGGCEFFDEDPTQSGGAS
ncbi:MAG TPA: bacteriocin fulvocin C-related protein [Acidobacteriota bacterium]|nr:bacteriocin fulvocin C-related protein [Acidobacteriota bacterium]